MVSVRRGTWPPLSELVGKEIVILDWANASYFGSEAGKPQWFFTQEKYRQLFHFSEKPGYFQPEMLMMSCDSHLWRDGLPTAYNNGVYI